MWRTQVVEESRVLAMIVLLSGFMLIVSGGTSGADWGKKETRVSCYAGDRDSNQYLGTVDVFEPAKAAAYCNMVYNDCNANCTGCYDDDASNEICIDNSGVPRYHE